MRQWNNSADSALITSTSGRARNASTKLAPGAVSANGSGAPPRNPNTIEVSVRVAASRASIGSLRLANNTCAPGSFRNASASTHWSSTPPAPKTG